MANKATLRGFFLTGKRPTASDFAALVDSAVNLDEPTNAGSIQLNGGVVVGNLNVPNVPGAIRWNGTNFEFNDGTFKPLNLAGGGGVTNPLVVGNVNIGSTVLANGTLSVFAHTGKYTTNDFGFGQNAGGATIVNSPLAGSIVLRNSPAQIVMTIQGGNATVNTNLNVVNQLIVGTPVAVPVIPANTKLAVYGDVQKLTGGAWSTWSDARLKEDIGSFNDGMKELIRVKPVRFRYKGMAPDSPEADQVGILAHEIREVFPYMVTAVKGKLEEGDAAETDILSFNASALQFVVVNAIKELHERIAALENLLKTNHA